jgi:hypothetical protein
MAARFTGTCARCEKTCGWCCDGRLGAGVRIPTSATSTPSPSSRCVEVGDNEAGPLTLESDKATMDIPPFAGTVAAVG